MARLLTSILILAIVAFGIWPYYSLYRINARLQIGSPQTLAPYVDLAAIQDNYRKRLDTSIDALVPGTRGDQPEAMRWLSGQLQGLGANAVERLITLDWVQRVLREAAESSTGTQESSFIDGIDFAFFESWNRFVVRLGPLGSETHVIMHLEDGAWRITDILD